MKICICTTPIRPIPTDFPPFGSMAIIQSLRKIDEEVSFYNIDYFRYSNEEVETYFKEQKFDVVGISAVVSTAYVYTKFLSKLIRRVSPDTKIIVGGNLAASAEILLKKCEVDFCVAGDGEKIIQELIKALYEKPLNYDLLRASKGISFLDEHGEFHFTGFGIKPTAEEVEFPDYSILDADGSLPYFITEATTRLLFGYEGEILPGKRVATVVMHKGCVARCTFCHRFEKGFRALPIDKTMDHIRHLMDEHNVGYILVGDENFGSDRKAAAAMAERLNELGVPWQVAGVRARSVSKESLQHWKDNGCYFVNFGTESGSPKILKIMEKNATLEENINALKWTSEAGMGTIIQLVLGMPGEDDDTIQETIEFLKSVSAHMKSWVDRPASELISINYAQALPGTPLYEFAREKGYIGHSIDEEEKYLIKISDTDAYKEDHFLNYTGLPLLKVLMWRPIILAHLDAHHYLEKNSGGQLSFIQVVMYYTKLVTVRITKSLNRLLEKINLNFTVNEDRKTGYDAEAVSNSGYFNIHSGLKYAPLLLNPITKRMFYPILSIIVALRNADSFKTMLGLWFEHIRWSLTRSVSIHEVQEKSLRKTIEIVPSTHVKNDLDAMLPLRKGR